MVILSYNKLVNYIKKMNLRRKKSILANNESKEMTNSHSSNLNKKKSREDKKSNKNIYKETFTNENEEVYIIKTRILNLNLMRVSINSEIQYYLSKVGYEFSWKVSQNELRKVSI